MDNKYNPYTGIYLPSEKKPKHEKIPIASKVDEKKPLLSLSKMRNFRRTSNSKGFDLAPIVSKKVNTTVEVAPPLKDEILGIST